MLLSKKKRQEYLKLLGYYNGKIDGIVGKKTKAAYKSLQKDYFVRKSDIDGIYGKNTDILLRNAYSVKIYCKNFKLEEFECGCGGKYCTGYPKVLNAQLLKNIQSLRDNFGATTVTSALRCNKHNSIVGGVASSRHKSGKAADVKNNISQTTNGRLEIMAFWKKQPKQRYTYCNINGSNPDMGESVHVDVK